jgi:hypothetical protein
MDLRVYYQNVRKTEQGITLPHVVVISLETGDGGKAGRMSEVSREIAAKLIVDGRARLANKKEADDYYEALRTEREQLQKRLQAERTHFNLVSDRMLETIQNPSRKDKV